ncbi:GAF domain-like protein [Podospora conica]|nr:GAF domain-like protein [Schizothecium conicum]
MEVHRQLPCCSPGRRGHTSWQARVNSKRHTKYQGETRDTPLGSETSTYGLCIAARIAPIVSEPGSRSIGSRMGGRSASRVKLMMPDDACSIISIPSSSPSGPERPYPEIEQYTTSGRSAFTVSESTPSFSGPPWANDSTTMSAVRRSFYTLILTIRAAQDTGDASNLSVLENGSVLILFLTAVATFAILAALDDDEWESALRDLDLAAARGPRAIRDMDKLRRDLEVRRRRRWALQDQEVVAGLGPTAACVYDSTQCPVAAVNLSVGLTLGLEGMTDRSVPVLLRAANEISHLLGSRRPD